MQRGLQGKSEVPVDGPLRAARGTARVNEHHHIPGRRVFRPSICRLVRDEVVPPYVAIITPVDITLFGEVSMDDHVLERWALLGSFVRNGFHSDGPTPPSKSIRCK